MQVDFASELTHADGTPFLQIDNTLNPNPHLPQGLELIHNPESVLGLVAEGYPVSDGVVTTYYPNLLDSIAAAAARDGFLVLLSHDTGGPLASRPSPCSLIRGARAVEATGIQAAIWNWRRAWPRHDRQVGPRGPSKRVRNPMAPI